jgi:hypothetical protein
MLNISIPNMFLTLIQIILDTYAHLHQNVFFCVGLPVKFHSNEHNSHFFILGNAMNTLFKVAIGIPALFFVFIGVRWAVDPSGAADMLGMSLLSGLGLSSQIGDIGALFLSMGVMMLLALVSRQPIWFYAPAMMLLMVASFRLIAWLVHGAAFAYQELAVEIIVSTLLIIAAARIKND